MAGDCSISSRLDAVTTAVRTHFGGSEVSRLTRPPAKGSWSVSECLIHIVRTNEAYIPNIQRACSPQYRSTFWEKVSPFSKSTGSGMIQSLGPESLRRYRTPKLFDPSTAGHIDDPLMSFFEHQEKIKPLLESMIEPSIGDRIISSPVSNLITFHASDLARMLVAHEERHLKQALAAFGA